MTAEHPDLAHELEAAPARSISGRATPADARHVDPARARRTPAELAAIREQEIKDGWARVAEQQRAEQTRTDRELARQAGGDA